MYYVPPEQVFSVLKQLKLWILYGCIFNVIKYSSVLYGYKMTLTCETRNVTSIFDKIQKYFGSIFKNSLLVEAT